MLLLDATTTSSEAPTTTNLDKPEKNTSTTTISADTMTTKKVNSDGSAVVQRRAVENVGQSNAKVVNLRSIGRSDIVSGCATLFPSLFLLLLFSLCLVAFL